MGESAGEILVRVEGRTPPRTLGTAEKQPGGLASTPFGASSVAMVGAARFEGDLSAAVVAAHRLGHPLSLVLVRSAPSHERSRRRLVESLQSAEGFAYDLGSGAFAILLPASTPWDAFVWALEQRRILTRGRFRRPVAISCTVAGLTDWEDAPSLLRRAVSAYERADAWGVPVWLERSVPHEAAPIPA